MIYCYCESCKNHDDDDTCKLNTITVSDRELTAAGFLPQCQEYEEEDLIGQIQLLSLEHI